MEKVKIQIPKEAWAQLLKDWREDEDRVARAENAILRYYVRMWAVPSPHKHKPVLTVLVAA